MHKTEDCMKSIFVIITILFALDVHAGDYERATIVTGGNLHFQDKQEVIIIVNSGIYKDCHISGIAEAAFDVSRIYIKLDELACEKNKYSYTYALDKWNIIAFDKKIGVSATHIEPSYIEKKQYESEISVYKKILQVANDQQVVDAIIGLEKAKYGYLELKKNTKINLIIISEPILLSKTPQNETGWITYPSK